MTRKRNIVNNESNTNYAVGNKIVFDTVVLKSNFFDFDFAYILARGDITNFGNNITHIEIKN